jgi:TrmH family RNA methyltransferase
MKHAPANAAQIADFSADFIHSLTPLQLRSEREARGQFLLEGMRGIHLALETDCLQTILFDSNADLPLRDLVNSARARGVRCVPVEKHLLLHLACGEDPQGIVGVAARRPITLEEAFASEGVWVALESVQQGGNLGSILRTSEAAGRARCDRYRRADRFLRPARVRSSMGAFWAQKIVRASWKEALDFKFSTIAVGWAPPPKVRVPYDTAHYPRDFWLWMGDERAGLSSRAVEACDELLSIPMEGRVDSLNLGVATAIVLYGARRRTPKKN